MAGHLLELFRSRGIATEVYEPKPNNPNVVAHLRPFQPGARTFLFNGHMDTFPVGNPARLDGAAVRRRGPATDGSTARVAAT